MNKPAEYPYLCNFEQTRIHYHQEGAGWGTYVTSGYSNKLVSVKKVMSQPDIASIHDFPKSSTAYLVWIEYSTGDSFGSHERKEVLPIALLKNREDAGKLRTQTSFWSPREEYEARKHQEYKKSYFKSSDGQVIELGYSPWTGYFEQLEEIHIAEVTIT